MGWDGERGKKLREGIVMIGCHEPRFPKVAYYSFHGTHRSKGFLFYGLNPSFNPSNVFEDHHRRGHNSPNIQKNRLNVYGRRGVLFNYFSPTLEKI